MRFRRQIGSPRYAWQCDAGCPLPAETPFAHEDRCVARAKRHAERTGHAVIVVTTFRDTFSPMEVRT